MSGAGARSGDGSEETIGQRIARAAAAKLAFDAIRVDYPPQTEVHARLEGVRLSARGREPGIPCGGAMLVAPNGVGKTEAIKSLVLHAAGGVPDGERRTPVLHIEIDSSGNPASVPTSILRALRVPRPDLGKEELRWLKAVHEMKVAGVELAVFDEFNRALKRRTMSGPIATCIREKIMDTGVCPVAFVGSEDAGVVLKKVPDLVERLDEKIDLAPLDWLFPGDDAIAIAFLRDLDQASVDRDLLPRPSALGDARTAELLCRAGRGRIRRMVKIVRFAMGAAVERRAWCISKEDLVQAVDNYAIAGGLADANPFLDAAA